MLQPGVQVRYKLAQRTLVHDVPTDTLGDLDGVSFGKVSGRGGIVVPGRRDRDPRGFHFGSDDPRGGLLLLMFHGLDGSHASVRLDTLALVVKVFTGGFGGPRQHASHHDRARTEGEGLGDVPDVLDTPVSDGRDAKLAGKLADGKDGRTLRSTDGHDLLRDTDRSGAHADPQGVGTDGDELCGLFPRDDVSGNDLQVGEGRLDPLDKLDLVDRVSLGRIEDDDVESGLDQQPQPVLVGLSGPDGGSTVQLLALGQLAGQGEVLVLQQVRSGQEGDQVALTVDDGEFTLLAVPDDLVGLLQRDARVAGDEVGGHDVGQRGRGVPELDVSTGDDSEELAADFAGLYGVGQENST